MHKDNSYIFRRLVSVNCNTSGPNGKRCSSVPSYYCCWMCKFLDGCARKWRKATSTGEERKSCRRKNKHWCSAALKAWLEERRK